MKKPKKSGSDYYNYKGFFSQVLVALVNVEYRFLWVNVGSSGSSSDTQVFNQSDFSEKIKDGTLGIPIPEPLGEGGPNFALFVWTGHTPQQMMKCTGSMK